MSRIIIPFPFFDIDITNFFGDERMKQIKKELAECKEKIATLETQVSRLSSQENTPQPPPKYSPKSEKVPITSPEYS